MVKCIPPLVLLSSPDFYQLIDCSKDVKPPDVKEFKLKDEESESKKPEIKKVLMAVANGSEEIETVAVVDTLRRTKLIEVTLAKVGDNKDKTCKLSRGLTLFADEILDEKLLNDN